MNAARQAAFQRRTQLYVPVNKPRFVAKAGQRGADAIILDLEDSIPAAEKQQARESLASACAEIRSNTSTHLIVRVNNDVTLESDLHAAIDAGVDSVLVPMVEHEDVIAYTDDTLNGSGRQTPIEIQILVETSAGILRLAQIAAARTNAVALMLGIEDLASELEIDPRSEYFDIRWAHGLTIAAARAAGIAPYGVLRNLADLDPMSYAEDVRRSRQFGYVGTLCIHPSQVPIAAEAFGPTATEVHEAREILQALEAGARDGTAAVRWRDRMIDTPMINRARRVLARAGYDDATDRES